ncbi:MAG: ERCC4 domain-containing protein, partial [Candidatus Woesearchaeota archaeon]
AKQYEQISRFPRILALTASPGTDMEKIQEICKNLFIEDIEARTNESEDVKPYIKEIKTELIKVKLPPQFIQVQGLLKSYLKDRMGKLKKWGVLKRTDINYVSKKDILGLQAQVRGKIASGEKDYTLWNSISVLAEIMKIYHAVELLETQGIISLYKYLAKINEEGQKSSSKAVKSIVNDPDFRSALIKTEKMYDEGIEHPKLIELQKIIRGEIEVNPNVKIIVFNQYRENALNLRNRLNNIEGVNSEIFVGQQKKEGTGLSQKEQKEMLDKFREGEYNVIVATSIGEEGLDIPKVDLVIFYEPVPSAIRSIQRRGRTGRQEEGRVKILICEKTRDESYQWAGYHKEKRMYRNITDMKKKLKLGKQEKEKGLDQYYTEKKIIVYADHREKANHIIKELIELGAEIKLEKLEYADYLLSSRVGAEFKTKEDFVNSIIDGRLLSQIKMLKEKFEKPIVVVEGIEDIYSIRNIHPNAIMGMISTIIVSYGIPLIQTKNSLETASLLFIIAKREQEQGFSEIQLHAQKPKASLKEQQEYVVSSLPNVGLGLAKELLKKFGSVKKIVNADAEELEEVPKVGKTIASKIKDVVDEEY